jgi:hypothetical protein
MMFAIFVIFSMENDFRALGLLDYLMMQPGEVCLVVFVVGTFQKLSPGILNSSDGASLSDGLVLICEQLFCLLFPVVCVGLWATNECPNGPGRKFYAENS